MHQVISVEKLPWHTSAELTRKRFQHQDEEQGARDRALMHTWCTDALPRQTPRCTVHWPAHDSEHWSRFHYSSTVAIYTNDYVFISMNCIKKETKHITYCIEGADTKKIKKHIILIQNANSQKHTTISAMGKTCLGMYIHNQIKNIMYRDLRDFLRPFPILHQQTSCESPSPCNLLLHLNYYIEMIT